MEIKAYAELRGLAFEWVEVNLIKSIDRCYQRVQVEELESQTQVARKAGA